MILRLQHASQRLKILGIFRKTRILTGLHGSPFFVQNFMRWQMVAELVFLIIGQKQKGARMVFLRRGINLLGVWRMQNCGCSGPFRKCKKKLHSSAWTSTNLTSRSAAPRRRSETAPPLFKLILRSPEFLEAKEILYSGLHRGAR